MELFDPPPHSCSLRLIRGVETDVRWIHYILYSDTMFISYSAGIMASNTEIQGKLTADNSDK